MGVKPGVSNGKVRPLPFLGAVLARGGNDSMLVGCKGVLITNNAVVLSVVVVARKGDWWDPPGPPPPLWWWWLNEIPP